jgi:MoxR-like ATPase
LPESQLDRFLFSIHLGYPDERAEKALLGGSNRRDLIARLKPVMSATDLVALRMQTENLHASVAAIDYAYALISATRKDRRVRVGLSPRAGIGLMRAAKAHAVLARRQYVIPEDLQAVYVALARHRLILASEAGGDGAAIARELLAQVAIP